MTQTDTAPGLPAGAVALPADPQHPDGNWVVLRDYRILDGGDVMDILEGVTGGQGYGKAVTALRRGILQRLVTNWSFDLLPLPATEGILRRLPGPVLIALFAAVKPALDMINGTAAQPVLDETTHADKASPTGGSSE